jgi:4,5-DOPA dioxygenase extradiol
MAENHPASSGKPMPVVFIGHGSPENAIADNEFTRAWKDLARSLPRPKAVLCISAHWLSEGTAVTAMKKPRTIHDFYGFPDELNAVEYPAGGSPELAKLIRESVCGARISLDTEWGLDHGTWSVLANMYTEADIPVLQMSLDYHLPPARQHRIGREIKFLRGQGVLILGSGNLVHNLMAIDFSAEPFDWALAFDGFVERALAGRDDDALIHYARQPAVRLAHPTVDHYLPLLYVLGACENETPRQFNAAFFAGSVSMRCAVFGE